MEVLVSYCIITVPKTKDEIFQDFPNLETAVKFYRNAQTECKKILTENTGKSGIYLWYNCITKHYYIGQSINLGDVKAGRLTRYYSLSYLEYKTRGESLIRRALLKYVW